MEAFRRCTALIAMVGSLAAALAMPASQAEAAAPNQLSNATVSPTSGDTTTIFSFGVHYAGVHPATSVTAAAGGLTIVLSLTSGTTTDGSYAGGSALPAGTWTATFSAVATKGNAPAIGGPTVTVTGPTPSTKPIVAPAPPAAPTAIPNAPAPPPAAPQATPVAVAAGSGTPVPAAAVLPGETAEGDPGTGAVVNTAPGASDVVPPAFWPVMLGGFGVITLVIAYSVLAMKRDRRRQVLAAEMALATRISAVDESSAEPERARAVWELDAALEEAPIGTVEYLPLEDGRAIGSIPENLPEGGGVRRGNSRLARITDARNSRQVEDRRSLLRRS